MILSQNMFMSMDSKKVRRNMNVFVIGGSAAYRSFNCIGPNIMQANCSYNKYQPWKDKKIHFAV